MNKKLCKTEFFDKEDFHNFDTTKINGKLLIYKDISQDSQIHGGFPDNSHYGQKRETLRDL